MKLTKEIAKAKAFELANILARATGCSFIPFYHQNAGWHYYAQYERITVFSCDGEERYHALISDCDMSGTGSPIWTNADTTDANPVQSLRKAIIAVNKKRDELQKTFNQADEISKGIIRRIRKTEDKPVPDCPNCGGERERSDTEGLYNCFFCGLKKHP